MTQTYKTGPGRLILGDAASEQEFAAQITSAVVAWDVEDGEIVPVLSGGEVAEDDEYTATLSGNVFGDIRETGITTWTWVNKGKTVPFVFVPQTDLDRAVSGFVKIKPLSVGGDVKAKSRSDFEFACVGEPALGEYDDGPAAG